jgi:polysaccharide biosynthesis/export protein
MKAKRSIQALVCLSLMLVQPVVLLAQTTAPASFNLSVSRSGYHLGPGDVLKITVLDFAEYSGDQMVLPDGSITLPVVGTIQAAGLTQEEVNQKITEKLQKVVKRPVVSTTLSFMRPVVVNITGEVRDPGPLQLNSLSSIPIMNGANAAAGIPLRIPMLSIAIANAGGVTREADIRNITISRLQSDGSAARFTVDLWKRIAALEPGRDIDLQDGDTVFIPRIAVGDLSIDRKLLAKSSLAPTAISIRIIGEVNKPGEIRVVASTTLAGAVAEAGGPTDKADLGAAFFTRIAEDGRIDKIALNLNNFTNSTQVQEGDIVVLPKSGVSYSIDFFSSIFVPFLGLSSLIRGFTGK